MNSYMLKVSISFLKLCDRTKTYIRNMKILSRETYFTKWKVPTAEGTFFLRTRVCWECKEKTNRNRPGRGERQRKT